MGKSLLTRLNTGLPPISTEVRRHSLNNRIDYKRGSHSLYGSGGLFYGSVTSPRAFGKAPLNDAASLTTTIPAAAPVAAPPPARPVCVVPRVVGQTLRLGVELL